MNIFSLASHELRRAADIVDQIEKLKEELSDVLGSPSTVNGTAKRKHRMSDAGRLAIAAAQKLRWAKAKAKSATRPMQKSVRRKMSAAGRAKIAAAAKARWAKAKAAGKKSL